MQLPKAQEILKSIISRHKQWGKQYSLSKDAEFSGNVILDALSVVMDHAQFEPEDWEGTVERLTADRNQKAREVNMGKAREAKLKNKRDELQEKLNTATSAFENARKAYEFRDSEARDLRKQLEEAEERYDQSCREFADMSGLYQQARDQLEQYHAAEVPD